MAGQTKKSKPISLISVGLVGWLVPGGGYFLLKENIHGLIIFVTIFLTFLIGIYIGSIGVVDPVDSKPWYIAQIMNSPFVIMLGQITAKGDFPVYGRAREIGQIYTSIAGLLNLLCIINAVYSGHLRNIREREG